MSPTRKLIFLVNGRISFGSEKNGKTKGKKNEKKFGPNSPLWRITVLLKGHLVLLSFFVRDKCLFSPFLILILSAAHFYFGHSLFFSAAHFFFRRSLFIDAHFFVVPMSPHSAGSDSGLDQ